MTTNALDNDHTKAVASPILLDVFFSFLETRLWPDGAFKAEPESVAFSVGKETGFV